MRRLWQQLFSAKEISSIDRYVPLKRTSSRLLLVIGMGLSIILAYSYGVGYYEKDRQAMRNYQDEVEARLEKKDFKIKRLKRATSEIKIVNDIRNSAIQDLKFEITVLQNQIDIRDRDLQFYRSILDPESNKVVVAQSFNLQPPLPSEEMQKFRIVVTQSGVKQQWIKGRLSFRLYGNIGDKQTQYGHKKLRASKTYDLKFKYFQYVDGKILLPKDFVARSATVTINVNGRKPRQQSLEVNTEDNI